MTKTVNKSKITLEKIYLHILQPNIPIAEFEFHSINDIKKLKNESAKEIAIQDLLEYYEDKYVNSLLNEIVSKLENNGKLHIQGMDIRSLCSSFVYGQIDTIAFKSLIINNKKNIYSISQIKNSIKQINGLEISKIKFINGLQYYLECIKSNA